MPAKGDTTGNNRDLHAITQEVKHYLQLQKRYMALDAVEKVTRLLSAVAVAVVCLILGAMILFFTLYALAECWAALLPVSLSWPSSYWSWPWYSSATDSSGWYSPWHA